MSYNKMRSTRENRWVIPKYAGSPIDNSEGNDLRDIVPKNQWFLLVDDDHFVHVRCENCGYIFQLSIEKTRSYDNHTIDNDGMVEPSIGHDPSHCGLHEWGKLEDWEAIK